jgi:thioredoxin reductase (NADPH)
MAYDEAMSDETVDCVIVGAGPAGLTAGNYLRRFHRGITIFDDDDSRAKRIPRSHNYPGFPEGVTGAALLARMREQLDAVGGEIETARVTHLRRDDGMFRVTTARRTLRARTVLLATGVRDNEPAIEGVADLRMHGLLRQCPICDGFEFSDRNIAIVGAGTHAMREALFLRDYSARVTLIAVHGAGDIPAECRAPLAERGISLTYTPPARVQRADGGIAITLRDGTEHRFDVMYAALGCVPHSQLAADVGAALDDSGNIVVDAHCRTSARGVYAAGDVVVGLDQLSVAVGHAAIAATAIHNDLRLHR